MKLEFDELNMPDFKEYFSRMSLNAEQKRKRREFAEEMEEYMFFYYELLTLDRETDAIIYLESSYLDLAERYADPDSYVKDLAYNFAQNIYSATKNNPETPYFSSGQRAAYVAANEANTFFNYDEYREAAASGYTKKTWLTMADERVRQTHWAVDGQTISINSTFIVGASLMRFPKDTYYNAAASEIVNCRCSIRYSR